MRKYIGNVTIYNSMKIENDSTREKLRLELLDREKEKVRKIKTDKHKEEIEGVRKISESILWFLDNDGKPPANIPIESIKEKYNFLNGQLSWIKVLVTQLYKKMEELNPEQAHIDGEERKKLLEEYENEILQSSENRINDQYILIELRKVIRTATRSIELRRKIRQELTSKYISGIQRIQTAICYLFADHIKKPENTVAIINDSTARYKIIKQEAEWLSIMAIDMEGKLLNLREMVYAGEELFK